MKYLSMYLLILFIILGIGVSLSGCSEKISAAEKQVVNTSVTTIPVVNSHPTPNRTIEQTIVPEITPTWSVCSGGLSVCNISGVEKCYDPQKQVCCENNLCEKDCCCGGQCLVRRDEYICVYVNSTGC